VKTIDTINASKAHIGLSGHLVLPFDANFSFKSQQPLCR
jgi:hypothetical protein